MAPVSAQTTGKTRLVHIVRLNGAPSSSSLAALAQPGPSLIVLKLNDEKTTTHPNVAPNDAVALAAHPQKPLLALLAPRELRIVALKPHGWEQLAAIPLDSGVATCAAVDAHALLIGGSTGFVGLAAWDGFALGLTLRASNEVARALSAAPSSGNLRTPKSIRVQREETSEVSAASVPSFCVSSISADARLPQRCVLIADTAALLVRSLSGAATPSLRSFEDSAGVAVSAVTLRASGALCAALCYARQAAAVGTIGGLVELYSLAVPSGGDARVSSLPAMRVLPTHLRAGLSPTGGGGVCGIAVAPDGAALALGYTQGGVTVHVADTPMCAYPPSGFAVGPLEEHCATTMRQVTSLVWTPTGDAIFVAGVGADEAPSPPAVGRGMLLRLDVYREMVSSSSCPCPLTILFGDHHLLLANVEECGVTCDWRRVALPRDASQTMKLAAACSTPHGPRLAVCGVAGRVLMCTLPREQTSPLTWHDLPSGEGATERMAVVALHWVNDEHLLLVSAAGPGSLELRAQVVAAATAETVTQASLPQRASLLCSCVVAAPDGARLVTCADEPTLGVLTVCITALQTGGGVGGAVSFDPLHFFRLPQGSSPPTAVTAAMESERALLELLFVCPEDGCYLVHLSQHASTSSPPCRRLMSIPEVDRVLCHSTPGTAWLLGPTGVCLARWDAHDTKAADSLRSSVVEPLLPPAHDAVALAVIPRMCAVALVRDLCGRGSPRIELASILSARLKHALLSHGAGVAPARELAARTPFRRGAQLEQLLHESLAVGDDGLLLEAAAALLRKVPCAERHRVAAATVRKTDHAYLPRLFGAIGRPGALLREAAADGELASAALLVLPLLADEGRSACEVALAELRSRAVLGCCGGSGSLLSSLDRLALRLRDS